MNNTSVALITVIALSLAACGRPEPEGAGVDAQVEVKSPLTVEAAGGNPAAEEAVAAIDGEYMREIVREISDDRYEGRGPGSRGDVAARKYLAKKLAAAGLKPGGPEGSWEQPFELVGINASQPESITITGEDKTMTLKQWDQYIVGSGVQQESVAIQNAEFVFVGYGMQAPEYDWDDYKDVDVSGKIVIIMNNDPDWDAELFEGEKRLWYGRWDYKYMMAGKQGAAGAMIIHTTPSAGYPYQVVQTSWTGVQFELPAGDEPRSQVLGWFTEDTAREIIAMSGHDLDELRERAYNRDFRPVPLGISASIEMDVEIQRVQSANVLGLVEGSDPELKDEVVIYTAHHDHLGIGTPNEQGDNIYNGAYDNASGVAIVMSIGKAFLALPEPPRRSVLIALVGAEEQGLLGSKYYAENPTFPSGKIAANINYDGGNIWGHTHDVTFIGLGKSTIDQLVTLIANEQGREVKPDQFADRGYFYRSDQFSFAKTGVPAVYLDPGMEFVDRPEGWGKEQINHFTEAHYHQPTDEYDDSWNFEGAETDAALGFWTGLAIANADEMPRWNEGDEFEAARLEALSELED